jgi:hypothetical protein
MRRNDPLLILTMPYTDYVRAKGVLFVLVWSFRLSVFLFPFWWIGLAIVSTVPKPVIDHWLGKTPEQIRIEAERDATLARYEKWEKQEKTRQGNIAKERQKAYMSEAAKKSQIELDELMNNPNVSDETARLRAFH